MNQKVMDKIVENGVNNLKEYGYPAVDKENIFTDMIYSAFFRRMLIDNLDQGFDAEINELLSKIISD